MYQAYEFTRTVNGEPRKETVLFRAEQEKNILYAIHSLWLNLYVTPAGKQLCGNGKDLTFEQFIDHVTPNDFVSYGVQMIKLDGITTQVDQMKPMIDRYELKCYQDLYDENECRYQMLYQNAERIAGRLETEKTNRHPVISTWDSRKISTKAIAWARQYASSDSPDLGHFFEQKVQKAKPGKLSGDLEPDSNHDGEQT